MNTEAIAVGLGGADLEGELVAPRRSLSLKLRKWVSDQPLGAVSALGVIVMIAVAI